MASFGSAPDPSAASASDNTPSTLESDVTLTGAVNDQFIAAKALFFQTEQQDSQSEWTLRMKVMEALRATLTTTTFTVPELASAASEHIAGPLSIQLADLRAQIVAEACTTVDAYVSCLGVGNCDDFVAKVLPNLFSNISKTKKVLTLAAATVLETIATTQKPSLLIINLLEYAQDKHRAIRAKAVELINTAVSRSNESELAEVLNSLLLQLKPTLSDSSQDVRVQARALVRQLQLRTSGSLQEEVALFIASLDASVQKQLNVSSAPGTPEKVSAADSVIRSASATPGRSPSRFSEFLKSQSKIPAPQASSVSAEVFVELHNGSSTAIVMEDPPKADKPATVPHLPPHHHNGHHDATDTK